MVCNVVFVCSPPGGYDKDPLNSVLQMGKFMYYYYYFYTLG